MNYGKAIKILRAFNNCEQIDVANYLKVSKSYISKIEKGERNLSANNLALLASFFDVPKPMIEIIALDVDDTKEINPEIIKNLGEALLHLNHVSSSN